MSVVALLCVFTAFIEPCSADHELSKVPVEESNEVSADNNKHSSNVLQPTKDVAATRMPTNSASKPEVNHVGEVESISIWESFAKAPLPFVGIIVVLVAGLELVIGRRIGVWLDTIKREKEDHAFDCMISYLPQGQRESLVIDSLQSKLLPKSTITRIMELAKSAATQAECAKRSAQQADEALAEIRSLRLEIEELKDNAKEASDQAVQAAEKCEKNAAK